VDKGLYVIKEFLKEKLEEIPNIINQSLDTQTRKSVQVHMVARHLTKKLAHEAPEEYGEYFWYDKIFYSKLDEKPVSIEFFVNKPFEKFINNDGEFVSDDKTSAFMLKRKLLCTTHIGRQKIF